MTKIWKLTVSESSKSTSISLSEISSVFIYSSSNNKLRASSAVYTTLRAAIFAEINQRCVCCDSNTLVCVRGVYSIFFNGSIHFSMQNPHVDIVQITHAQY